MAPNAPPRPPRKGSWEGDVPSRRVWRIRGKLQRYLLVRNFNLADDQAPEHVPPAQLLSELDRWLSSLLTRRICHEVYEALTGSGPGDLRVDPRGVEEGLLRRRLATALREGELIALPLGPLKSPAWSLGGVSESPTTPPMSVPLLEEAARPERDQEPRTARTWMTLELVDEDGVPMAGVRYRLVLPGGEVREGRLGEDGTARADGIPEGDCRVSFPELDENLLEAQG